MGQVKNILLNNFRNFINCELSFNSKFNILYGSNGSGKTNILEGISLLGKGRGFRNSNLLSLYNKNKNNFTIQSEYQNNSNIYNLKVYSKLINEKCKKITSVNDEISKDAEKFLYSTISFLFFLPEMERLFLSSPTYRRNFIDKLIFSQNKNYNKLINKYKKNILERSKILQSFKFDDNWLITIEKQIANLAIEIYKTRKNQIEILNKHLSLINFNNKYPYKIFLKILDKFDNYYNNEELFINFLNENREFDKKLGGSRIGPHKSDFETIVNDKINASNLSTGQQKTIVLLLLITQCNYLTSSKNIRPILLFDEICSHLDLTNRNLLLDFAERFDVQLFLTGTEKNMFSFLSTNANFYNITDI